MPGLRFQSLKRLWPSLLHDPVTLTPVHFFAALQLPLLAELTLQGDSGSDDNKRPTRFLFSAGGIGFIAAISLTILDRVGR